MSSEQVSNEEFLAKLAKLFESSSSAHSVYVNHKRVSSGQTSSGQWPVVVRATDGRGTSKKGRTKFSTHVDPSHMSSFQNSYSTLLRASLAGCLKKRDKAKERRVDKMLKEKRKRMEEQTSKVKVTAVGRSRGPGRRKRAQAQKKADKMRQERRMANRAAKAPAASTVEAS